MLLRREVSLEESNMHLEDMEEGRYLPWAFESLDPRSGTFLFRRTKIMLVGLDSESENV